MPEHASQLYARNIQAFLELIVTKEGELALDWDDEIVTGSCVARDGAVLGAGARAVEGAS